LDVPTSSCLDYMKRPIVGLHGTSPRVVGVNVDLSRIRKIVMMVLYHSSRVRKSLSNQLEGK